MRDQMYKNFINKIKEYNLLDTFKENLKEFKEVAPIIVEDKIIYNYKWIIYPTILKICRELDEFSLISDEEIRNNWERLIHECIIMNYE